MNRSEMRRRAKEFNTPHKLEMLERQMRTAIRQEYEERTEKEMSKFIKTYTTIVFYVLWHCFGMGQKRLKKFSDELDNHLDILGEDKKYGLTIDDMIQMLKKEAKIDLKF
jgi:hypothetical protein